MKPKLLVVCPGAPRLGAGRYLSNTLADTGFKRDKGIWLLGNG